jgi:hypothetical protein
MSEIPECARVRAMLPEILDGAPAPEHLQSCAECREALAQFIELDRELTGWGRAVSRRNPPLPGAREQLAATLATLPARRPALRWIPAGAVAVAAALALATIVPHKKPADPHPLSRPFVAIPYMPPLDPHENTAIVHMNIRVSTLLAAGYRIASDPDAIISADVLVGEDGRAHAIRIE